MQSQGRIDEPNGAAIGNLNIPMRRNEVRGLRGRSCFNGAYEKAVGEQEDGEIRMHKSDARVFQKGCKTHRQCAARAPSPSYIHTCPQLSTYALRANSRCAFLTRPSALLCPFMPFYALLRAKLLAYFAGRGSFGLRCGPRLYYGERHWRG
jgi:hypothetical protein